MKSSFSFDGRFIEAIIPDADGNFVVHYKDGTTQSEKCTRETFQEFEDKIKASKKYKDAKDKTWQ